MLALLSFLSSQLCMVLVFPARLSKVAAGEKCCDWNYFLSLSSCREGQPALRSTLSCHGLSPWPACTCCDTSSPGATLRARWLWTTLQVPSISTGGEKSQGRRLKAQVLSCCTLRPFCQDFAVLLLVKRIVFFLSPPRFLQECMLFPTHFMHPAVQPNQSPT